MSELTNPLFDDEKEFLERKKLEYERALVADVESLKVQSVQVGKVVAVGAGAVAGIWLLRKLFGGPKKAKSAGASSRNGGSAPRKNQKGGRSGATSRSEDKDMFDPNAEFYTDGLGVRHRSVTYHKSAAQSAATFREHGTTESDDDFGNAVSPAFGSSSPADDVRTDDGGFGGFGTDDSPDRRDPDLIGAEVFANAYVAANVARPQPADSKPKAAAGTRPNPAATHADEQPEAYIPGHDELHTADARAAAPASTDANPFAEASPQPAAGATAGAAWQSAGFRYGRDFAGSLVSNFLQSEAGRVLVAQAAAVALALATKQLAKWFPGKPEAGAEAAAAAPLTETGAATAKNADLAAASAVASSPVAPRFPEPAASSDDPLTPFQPLA